MNQVKIGKFISARRKAVNLTQAQLAEKLCITDRAVSKWERGLAMPDSSIMLDLCEILKITVNDLLSGEVVSMDNYNKEQEKNLLEMAKELEKKNKTIWTTMWVIMIVSMIALFASLFIAKFLIKDETLQIIVALSSVVVFLIPCFYALKLEVSVGAYKCENCGHEFVPTYSEALWAMHMGFTRYLKCPNCGKRTWCKKVINKEEK